ncbi:MAG: hypothetical protein ACQESK_09195 [Bacteroidota bacterium]
MKNILFAFIFFFVGSLGFANNANISSIVEPNCSTIYAAVYTQMVSAGISHEMAQRAAQIRYELCQMNNDLSPGDRYISPNP